MINGVALSGKDLFVDLFIKNYKHKCYNWSTVDDVKSISMKSFGWDGKKTDKSRTFLSELKKLWTDFNNGPFNSMVDKIDESKKISKKIVYFIHCREPKEIQKFVDRYGEKCVTLLIERDGLEIPSNNSDQSVLNFDYNYTIKNNGTVPELEENVIKFIEKL